MTDYTPSDAAKDYVGGMFDEPSTWAPIIVAAFDAGIAHERESRKPRMRLTDANDERIKPGARVSLDVPPYEDGTWVTYRYVLTEGVSVGTIDYVRQNIRDGFGTWTLLAEAPNPDAELVTTLFRTPNGSDWHPDDIGAIVALIRTAGYDVVKRES